MILDWHGAWASVIHHPLFGIGITLGAYQLVLAAFEKTRWIFLQPVLVSMLLVIGVLVGLRPDLCRVPQEHRDPQHPARARPLWRWRCRFISTCDGFGSCSGRFLLRW